MDLKAMIRQPSKFFKLWLNSKMIICASKFNRYTWTMIDRSHRSWPMTRLRIKLMALLRKTIRKFKVSRSNSVINRQRSKNRVLGKGMSLKDRRKSKCWCKVLGVVLTHHLFFRGSRKASIEVWRQCQVSAELKTLNWICHKISFHKRIIKETCTTWKPFPNSPLTKQNSNTCI